MLFPDSFPGAGYEIVFHVPGKRLRHAPDRSVLQLVHATTRTRMQALHCAAELYKTQETMEQSLSFSLIRDG